VVSVTAAVATTSSASPLPPLAKAAAAEAPTAAAAASELRVVDDALLKNTSVDASQIHSLVEIISFLRGFNQILLRDPNSSQEFVNAACENLTKVLQEEFKFDPQQRVGDVNTPLTNVLDLSTTLLDDAVKIIHSTKTLQTIFPLIVRWLQQNEDLDKISAAIFSLRSLTCVQDEIARGWLQFRIIEKNVMEELWNATRHPSLSNDVQLAAAETMAWLCDFSLVRELLEEPKYCEFLAQFLPQFSSVEKRILVLKHFFKICNKAVTQQPSSVAPFYQNYSALIE